MSLNNTIESTEDSLDRFDDKFNKFKEFIKGIPKQLLVLSIFVTPLTPAIANGVDDTRAHLATLLPLLKKGVFSSVATNYNGEKYLLFKYGAKGVTLSNGKVSYNDTNKDGDLDSVNERPATPFDQVKYEDIIAQMAKEQEQEQKNK